jgi:SAM-dependent methyltransferase
MISTLNKVKAFISVFYINIFNLLFVSYAVKKAYKHTPTYSLSKQYREEHEPSNPDLIYGELSIYAFLYLLALILKKDQAKIYDLGCGDARLLLAAVLFFKNIHAVGIEIIPEIKNAASNIALSLQSKIHKNKSNLSIIENDFLKVDFSDAEIVYVNGVALVTSTWGEVNEKFKALNKHVYVISVERKLDEQVFELIYAQVHHASWGKARVYIFRKIH